MALIYLFLPKKETNSSKRCNSIFFVSLTHYINMSCDTLSLNDVFCLAVNQEAYEI